MHTEDDGGPRVWCRGCASEMRCRVPEPGLGTGAGGRSPITSAGWWRDHPSAGAGPGCGEAGVRNAAWAGVSTTQSAQAGPDAAEQGVRCARHRSEVTGHRALARTPCSSFRYCIPGACAPREERRWALSRGAAENRHRNRSTINVSTRQTKAKPAGADAGAPAQAILRRRRSVRRADPPEIDKPTHSFTAGRSASMMLAVVTLDLAHAAIPRRPLPHPAGQAR